MKKISKDVDLSSLPCLKGEAREVEVSISSSNEDKINKYFKLFLDYLIKNKINYILK